MTNSTEKDIFSVPPEWTKEQVIHEGKALVHWARNSGPYAPPEIWFQRIPGFVAILAYLLEELDESSL